MIDPICTWCNARPCTCATAEVLKRTLAVLDDCEDFLNDQIAAEPNDYQATELLRFVQLAISNGDAHQNSRPIVGSPANDQ